jgi:spore coat-associated protein N
VIRKRGLRACAGRSGAAGRWSRRPWGGLPLGLMLVIMASCAAATSAATFVVRTQNPSNAFAAGSFKLLNSADGSYAINVTGLRPGQSTTGTLSLTNQGDYVSGATISKVSITDTPVSPALSGALTLLIEDITSTPQTLWNNTMSSFTTLTLTDFAKSQARTYRFTVTFPQAGATPSLQGANSVMVLKSVGVAK